VSGRPRISTNSPSAAGVISIPSAPALPAPSLDHVWSAGSDVRALAADWGAVYAGADRGGVWRSDDHGRTWSEIGLEREQIRSRDVRGRLRARSAAARALQRLDAKSALALGLRRC
jgi:hypothetical protein